MAGIKPLVDELVRNSRKGRMPEKSSRQQDDYKRAGVNPMGGCCPCSPNAKYFLLCSVFPGFNRITSGIFSGLRICHI